MKTHHSLLGLLFWVMFTVLLSNKVQDQSQLRESLGKTELGLIVAVHTPLLTQAVPAPAAKPPPAKPSTNPTPSSNPKQSANPQPATKPKSSEKKSSLWLLLLPVGYLSLSLCIFTLRPLCLLKLDDWLKPVVLKLPWGLELSPRLLLWFRYHPRVLDAWVTHHLPAARAAFLCRSTVEDREIHLPVPVALNRTILTNFQGADLRPHFDQSRCLLLICGEGGSGKTSLACQIARWAMSDDPAQRPCTHYLVPVLIETDLSATKPLPDAIRQQLPLSDDGLPVSNDLLSALMCKRRLLLIVDHFSEMGKASRQQIQTDLLRWPVNALIFTSRLEDELLDRNKVLLQPQRIEGGRLFDFFSAYLRQQACRDFFDDEDLFQACRRLTGMNPERQITVLLAKLYIEQMIDAQLGRAGALPDNIPDLMCSYLNRLNASVDQTVQYPNLAVQRWAKAIAWLCLESTYQPTAAQRDEALKILAAELEVEGEESVIQPADCLAYLEQKLRLIHILEPGDKLRLILDPLAEYLAASYVVANCANWREFLDAVAAKKEDPASIRGFLLAVRDCCLAKGDKTVLPGFVPDALAQLAGLDPAELEQARRQLRVRRLANNLVLPDAADRAYAAGELGKLGLEGRAATTALKRCLFNWDEELVVRRQVLETLVAMDWGIEQCFGLLEDKEETLSLRCLAAGLLKQQATYLERTVPDPIVEFQEGKQSLRLAVIPVEVQELDDGITLELVKIPKGSFLMGSSENIPDSYDNEKPQHCVTLQSFLMGRYPVTQAQWRVVAGWEAVERELDLDPSTFKGEQLPVESISWYEAVEFCARLSYETGRNYRLPSEAEWEYACRAGTTTTYHLGERLASDLANFERVRDQTTPVGLFGVANAWGLYDMHGNVLEWCADPWHDSYDGAPEDGRVWLESGNFEYKLLRGGSWSRTPSYCRSAVRYVNSPDFRFNSRGFRVVCALV